jgi:predicted DNA binding CopG/RHH family protein
MAKSITVRPKHKKKVGRPATGRDPTITVRLPSEMIEQIEQEAALQKTGRSQVIREALQKGLGRKR